MIRLGERIRLTPAEKQRWAKITGFQIPDVQTLDELDAFIDDCKRHYAGEGPETTFLHFLMDRERRRCFHGPTEVDSLGG